MEEGGGEGREKTFKRAKGCVKVYTVPLEPLQVLSITVTFKGAPENLA
jgi:hypothetical protein